MSVPIGYQKFPNDLAYAGAFSRGRIARLWGEGKDANPYDESQPYHAIWIEGHESVRNELGGSR